MKRKNKRQSVTACGYCFSLGWNPVLHAHQAHDQKNCEARHIVACEAKTYFRSSLLSVFGGREAMTWNTSVLCRPGNIVDASQMFLYNNFPLILRLLVQSASIFSSKYFCRRDASLKAFFPVFKARPLFQPDQDSGLPVHVYGLTDLQTHGRTHNAMT